MPSGLAFLPWAEWCNGSKKLGHARIVKPPNKLQNSSMNTPLPADFPATLPAPSSWFDGFEKRQFNVSGVVVCARISANWLTQMDLPVLVLLHGFPQTHVMWHRVAQALKNNYRLVLPDLRGYGDSSHLPGLPDHSNYSKRAMAQDVVGLLDQLNVDQFFLCGHDRGGRVAHRLAVDHPARVRRLCVLDIAPTLDMYNRTDMDFARAYYHWFHLIQPSPLPEKMIAGNVLNYLHTKLGGWGSAGTSFIEPEAMAEYERCMTMAPEQPGDLMPAVHTACEDYRASAGIDLLHDKASRAQDQKIMCDTLVLWGERGVVHKMFAPIRLWQAQCAGEVSGHVVPSGHFIPEELPDVTVASLREFMV
jgi:haloacetate dehalogenase